MDFLKKRKKEMVLYSCAALQSERMIIHESLADMVSCTPFLMAFWFFGFPYSCIYGFLYDHYLCVLKGWSR